MIDDDLNAKVFWPVAAIGMAVIGFGIVTLFNDSGRTHPDQWIRWFIGAALAHDFVLAPVVFVSSHLLKRKIGRRWSGPLIAAAISSGVFLLIAYPFVRRFGADPNNPSILPLSYGTNLLVILAIVWTIALIAAWITARSRKDHD